MNQQAGFSIITVIFVLVVLAGLGAVMAQLGTTQHLGVAMALEGRQAYYAAYSGLERARARVVVQGLCDAQTFQFEIPRPRPDGTEEVVPVFDVATQCSQQQTVNEAGRVSTSYVIQATATGIERAVYGQVRRTLQMSVWK